MADKTDAQRLEEMESEVAGLKAQVGNYTGRIEKYSQAIKLIIDDILSDQHALKAVVEQLLAEADQLETQANHFPE